MILGYADFATPFVLYTDASDAAVGVNFSTIMKSSLATGAAN